jgi:hypothetical protein
MSQHLDNNKWEKEYFGKEKIADCSSGIKFWNLGGGSRE